MDFLSSLPYLTANLAHGGLSDVARDLIGDDGVRRTARVRPLAPGTLYHLLVDFRLRGENMLLEDRVTLRRRRRPCCVKEPPVRLLSNGKRNKNTKKTQKNGARGQGQGSFEG